MNKQNTKTNQHEVFEIWIVENGSLAEFARGWRLKPTATANMHWGDFDTLDEVRARFRELADENFRRDNGPYDEIWAKCADERPEEAPEGFSEPEIECEKYVAQCAESLCIEWHNDLKWVRCRKMSEDESGNRTLVEVL